MTSPRRESTVANTAVPFGPPVDPRDIERDGGRYLRLPDGRIVEYFVYGSEQPDARVLVQMHGSSGSGHMFCDGETLPENPAQLEALNIRGIAVSLPGWGYTTAVWPRRFVDWPHTDLEPVLDQEGVKQFMMEGTSEGTGPCLAAAHYFGTQRLTAVGLYVPWVPNPICDEYGLPHQYEELAGWLTSDWFDTTRFRWAAHLGFRGMRAFFQYVPSVVLEKMVPKALRQEFPNLPSAFAKQARRASRHSHYGLIATTMHDAMWGDWGYDVRDVRAAKALIYCVRDDRQCPVEHGEWLAGHLEATGAEVELKVEDSGGHMAVFGHLRRGDLSEQLVTFKNDDE